MGNGSGVESDPASGFFMRVFLAVASLAPRYGGPARSVSRLACALCQNGVEVGIWAPDGSTLNSPFLPTGMNIQRLAGSLADAFNAFPFADIVHDNGIWLPHNHALAIFALKNKLPRLVSTRGMIEPWAFNHKRWKKRVAWWLYQKADLRNASCQHVTADHEAASIKRFDFRIPVCCIPNGVDIPAVFEPGIIARELRTALFVGRIYPVKGLPILIESWAKVRPAGWKMKIVGPDEAGHRAEVEALIRQAELESVIEFTGSLDGEELHRVYQEADLFILPSHTENFGMAVGEAMAHGLPVITTHGTPWQLLEQENCGWWVPVSVDGIATALADATSRPADDLRSMGARGRRVVAERFAWDGIARQFIDCYRWLLGEGDRPGCVVE